MNRKILLPFNPIYASIIQIRNFLYNHNFFKSTKSDLPVICVGNITVGGTGKTPHVEYLISFLKNKYKLAILSRGYKRKTKGFILSNNETKPHEIGDEPFQIKSRYPEINVAVDEKRVRGVASIELRTDTQVVILDDAFQHRAIEPSYSIVLVDYNRPVFEDYMLPAGNLREPMSGLKRANSIIVTKCPESITDIEMKFFKQKLKLYPYQNIYFSYFKYSKPKHILNSEITEITDKDILLVTGIANTKYLEKYINKHAKSYKLQKYPDHHDFTISDIKNIVSNFGKINSENKLIICTEKDKVKLLENKKLLKNVDIFSIDIEVALMHNKENEFQKEIIKDIERVRRIKG
jgi:tetraacyldisaccharide 4'-kinase